MKALLTITLLCCSSFIIAQLNYGTPKEGELPKKLQELEKGIEVINYPKKIDPILIEGTYYWKHNTTIFHKGSELKVIEYGAYVYYNNQWNLRKSYELKSLDKTFGTKKQLMQQAQPYTWANNWRTDSNLYGGWAMWYIIGVSPQGKKICGYEKIHTTANLINQ